jgi:N-acyl-L-homoserine lactone synthetase
MEQVILLQPEAIFTGNSRIIEDNSLWWSYLKKACRLRGEVFHTEGLLDGKNLTQDGRETDEYDELGTHFLMIEGEKTVGTLRMVELLSLSKDLKEIPSQILFRKLGLRKYETALQYLLAELVKKNRKVVECSRLTVKEEYRRFRNIHSQVAISLITSVAWFCSENHIDDMIITSGIKYKTSTIYKRIGFNPVFDFNDCCPLEPFYYNKFNDYSELMHCPVKKGIKNLSGFMDRLRPVYERAKIIKKR